MARRSYDQFCGLAYALDVVGERWTLLIVRELMAGPKRYTDLAAALDGIGTSLLAARTKQLEGDGVIRRRFLEPPAASVVYELTDMGRELARATVPLALWGARHLMTGRTDDETFRPEWSLVFIADSLTSEALAGVTATYEFRIDDHVASLRVRDGQAEVVPGSVDAGADAFVTADSATIASVAGGRLAMDDAVVEGHIQLDGDPEALVTLAGLLEGALASFQAQVGPESSEAAG